MSGGAAIGKIEGNSHEYRAISAGFFSRYFCEKNIDNNRKG